MLWYFKEPPCVKIVACFPIYPTDVMTGLWSEFLMKGIVVIQPLCVMLVYLDEAFGVEDIKADLSFYATAIKVALWSLCF